MASREVTVVVRLKAKPGKEAQVRKELFDLLTPTRAEEGCLNFEMHETPNDQALFMFHENSTSEDCLARHFEKPHIKRSSNSPKHCSLSRWI